MNEPLTLYESKRVRPLALHLEHACNTAPSQATIELRERMRPFVCRKVVQRPVSLWRSLTTHHAPLKCTCALVFHVRTCMGPTRFTAISVSIVEGACGYGMGLCSGACLMATAWVLSCAIGQRSTGTLREQLYERKSLGTLF